MTKLNHRTTFLITEEQRQAILRYVVERSRKTGRLMTISEAVREAIETVYPVTKKGEK